MAKFSTFFTPACVGRKSGAGRLLVSAWMGAALLLSGCALEVENRQAAREVAHLSQPPGSVYTGWRVFQDRCAQCHGPDASGTGIGPDLLVKVNEMGPRRFMALVLKRYDWNLPLPQTDKESEAMDALVEEVMQRKSALIAMPAWEGEPRVSVHIADLYAYLSARAQGTQGSGRPHP